MTVYLAWTSEPVDVGLAGPWSSLHIAADGLTLVDSDDTLSRVYHELKWSLSDGAAVFVAPLDARAKLARVAPGTRSWLTERGIG